MREALARSDHDFVLVAERRPARASRVKLDVKPRRFAWAAPILRRPGKSLLVAIACVLAGGIIVNALFLQNVRHPAPMFSGRTPPPARVAVPAPKPALAIPMPRPRPAPSGFDGPAHTAMPPEKAAAPSAPAAPSAARGDTIGALISGSGADKPSAVRKETSRVSAAQRALNQLGYKLEVDGLAGPSTKSAVEKFERERGLPVTGALAGKTLRMLSLQSGVKIP